MIAFLSMPTMSPGPYRPTTLGIVCWTGLPGPVPVAVSSTAIVARVAPEATVVMLLAIPLRSQDRNE
ncbi:hypothetical protein [Nannocystis pusilla]|uniref:hypothetical protein n=1 Tax=Nannocystis pusilla TaxID=889268 RepID=UPI003DA299C9